MIRIEKLTIQNFRGIKSIVLDLSGKNFAVCGPNGSGKSGVVDAIEFVLTGDISRLSGKGTGGLSVKEHGPHVDSTPEGAFVEADVVLGGTGVKTKVRRTVKQPKTTVVTPESPAVRTALAEVAAHPEFVLSRREIIKFVLAEPSKRSELVQSLLRLEELDAIRGVLTKIANAEERESKSAIRALAGAEAELAKSLAIPTFGEAALLKAVNERRALLGIEPIAELTATTSLRDGLPQAGSTTIGASSKVRVLADLKTARDALQDLGHSDLK